MKISEKIKNFLEKLRNYPEQKKKIILWTIVVIIALPLAYLWINSAIKSFSKIGQSIEIPQAPAINLAPTSTTTDTKTADWKTYTNSKYGFEIKYPSEWTLEEESKYFYVAFKLGGQSLININMGERTMEDSCKIPFSRFVKAVEVPAIQNYESLNSIDKVNTQDDTEAYKTTWNYSGMCSDVNPSDCRPGGISSPMTYIYNKNAPCSDIVLSLRDENYTDTYNTMISTFKFTPVK